MVNVSDGGRGARPRRRRAGELEDAGAAFSAGVPYPLAKPPSLGKKLNP